ncbi:MAG: glycosyltransferase family 1 protein [bacterium]
MNIGIDIRTLMDAQYSGVSEFTLNIVKEILKSDKNNYYKLFYNSWADVRPKLPKFLTSEKNNSTKNFELINPGYPNKVFNYCLQKTFAYPKIDKFIGGADVFFAPHYNFLTLSGQCRGVLTVHDLSFLRYGEFFSWKKNIWHYLINVKGQLQRFNKIVAVSENTKKDIVDIYNISSEKIDVIYHGIDSEYRIMGDSDIDELSNIKTKYNLPDRFILYLGNIEPRKNITGLIQAYELLREENKFEDIKLVIAGGMGWKTKKIFHTWNNSKYKNDIKFLGYVARNDKPALYNLASIFVYPSFYEGFGLPALEAMACGIPVIAGNSGSLSEVVGSSGILINPYNINEIKEAVAIVLEDRRLCERLIESGFLNLKRFSWAKAGEKYLRIFRE